MTTASPPRTVRVAIYCRKSVTEGLDQEFNSLDAQRQAAEAYVKSQEGEAWVALPKRYDDGGFTGSTTERPAFQALLRDIQEGYVDVVAVYKIDRLSRSSRDFVRVLDLFEQHHVDFVSVTQQFSTTNSMGKLVLNILMSFSEFERDVISERIRDKVRATRRRGMWTGGRPVLGYDVVDKCLVVNEDEAQQVRDTFELYLERGSLRATIAELKRRAWSNKSFLTKSGRCVTGRPFTKATLHALLTNVLYRGQVRCGDEVVAGVHEPIVDGDLWDTVQEQLRSNGNGEAGARNKTGAILRGLVYCGRCGSPMLHTFTTKRTRRYRYYACSRNHNEGAASCPKARVPAGKFEQFVADQVRIISQDAGLLAKTAESVAKAMASRRVQLTSERRRIEQERRRLDAQRSKLLSVVPPSAQEARPLLDEVAEIDDRVRVLEGRLGDVRAGLKAIGNGTVDADDLRDALVGFTPIWEQLFPREQERILRLLIERVTYDPDGGDVDIELRSCGIEALAEEAREAS